MQKMFIKNVESKYGSPENKIIQEWTLGLQMVLNVVYLAINVLKYRNCSIQIKGTFKKLNLEQYC